MIQGCVHCSANPKSKKPFIEKLKIEYSDLTRKLIPFVAEKVGLPEECLVCLARVTVWLDLRNFPEGLP
jgi:hypothetical protein